MADIRTKNPREAAYHALIASIREEKFIGDTLRAWHDHEHPSDSDYQFARQIAYGTAQRALSLDSYAEQLSKQGKLSLKLKERVLLRLALYQYFYLERVPLYAIADEMVALAKKQCHSIFVRYLNATLRALENGIIHLPEGDDVASLSVRYSYPPFFVQTLMRDYGLEETKSILEAGNCPAKTMARVRVKAANLPEHCRYVCQEPCPVIAIDSSAALFAISSSPDYYIQNITPATLIAGFCQSGISPKRILDLCSSPGGKLIALHDFFPQA